MSLELEDMEQIGGLNYASAATALGERGTTSFGVAVALGIAGMELTPLGWALDIAARALWVGGSLF
jgi:hypothetical protein